jgi:hypothetical protein
MINFSFCYTPRSIAAEMMDLHPPPPTLPDSLPPLPTLLYYQRLFLVGCCV